MMKGMESRKKILGAAEECHSSESGWTMYLGSPIDDDDDGHSDGDDDDKDDNEEEEGEENSKACDAEDESDDSMASDASSGPSHHVGYPWENSEGSQVEAGRTKDKEIAEKKVEKKEMAFMDNKGKVRDENSKVRKKSLNTRGRK